MTSRDDNDISALLATLRHAESADTAPAHVETAVMNAWDAAHPAAVRARLSVASQIASLAAAAALAVGLGVLGEHLRTARLITPPLSAEATSPVILVGEPMLDGEQIRLVRMRMPA